MMKTKISIATILVVTVLFLAGCQSSAKGSPVHLDDGTMNTITPDDAQKIALEDAGVVADIVTNLHITTDEDDGKLQYEVEFRKDNYEYEYEIDAASGKIITRSKEQEGIPPTTEPTTTQPAVTEPVTESTIAVDEAKKIALDHAKLTESKVSGLKAKLDKDDGVSHYDVEFRSGDYEYSYEINATTGKIIEWDKDYEPAKSTVSTEPTTAEPETISADKAKELALDHAKLKKSDVTGLKAELDKDDGVSHYDVEFRSGDYEYSYEINATTGKIIEWDKDYEPKKTVDTTEPTTAKPETISADKAKEIALDHAKLKKSDVTGLKAELDKDDGVSYYEVEFRSGNYEYSYEINATTGKIIEWDKELDD